MNEAAACLEKHKIRQEILKRRNSLEKTERDRGDLLLAERILGHQWFYSAQCLLCYVSYGSEIDTKEILREALRSGVKVYVPKVMVEKAPEPEMRFYRINALEELKEGYRGIPEPSKVTEEYLCGLYDAERTLVLMPGVAFDHDRNRIGYGKGFYDRFLASHEALQQRTVAVGYLCQLLEKIPFSDTDIRPCQVICV